MQMGHTACGAIKGAIDNAELGNLTGLLGKIKPAIDATAYAGERSAKNYAFVDAVARKKLEKVILTSSARKTKGANKLGAARMIIVGSPDYFARYGVPKTPGDLARHNRLGFNYARMAKGWPLIDSGVEKTIPPSGNVQVSDGDALRALAIIGVGLVRLASFIVKDDIAANRLVPVLEEFNPGDIDELHAVYLGQGGLLPIRIRVFLEFLAERIKIGDDRPAKDT